MLIKVSGNFAELIESVLLSRKELPVNLTYEDNQLLVQSSSICIIDTSIPCICEKEDSINSATINITKIFKIFDSEIPITIEITNSSVIFTQGDIEYIASNIFEYRQNSEYNGDYEELDISISDFSYISKLYKVLLPIRQTLKEDTAITVIDNVLYISSMSVIIAHIFEDININFSMTQDTLDYLIKSSSCVGVSIKGKYFTDRDILQFGNNAFKFTFILSKCNADIKNAVTKYRLECKNNYISTVNFRSYVKKFSILTDLYKSNLLDLHIYKNGLGFYLTKENTVNITSIVEDSDKICTFNTSTIILQVLLKLYSNSSTVDIYRGDNKLLFNDGINSCYIGGVIL